MLVLGRTSEVHFVVELEELEVMVSVPVDEVREELEDAELELSDQLWKVSLDVCEELSVVVGVLEIVP